MMKREEAVNLIEKNIQTKNLIKHFLAVEAVMGALARYFHEDEEKWKLAGLLHDIDYEKTKNQPEFHSLLGAEMLEKEDVPPDVIYAIKCHNHIHGLERKALMDQALFATDPVTGLIVAGALIRPEKRLEALDVDSLIKRFHEKAFARGASRERIAACSDLGLSLEEFLSIALGAMQENHEQLGL
jgi:putative nucleotidyltransferase with HDIG domain